MMINKKMIKIKKIFLKIKKFNRHNNLKKKENKFKLKFKIKHNLNKKKIKIKKIMLTYKINNYKKDIILLRIVKKNITVINIIEK